MKNILLIANYIKSKGGISIQVDTLRKLIYENIDNFSDSVNIIHLIKYILRHQSQHSHFSTVYKQYG